MKTYTLAEFEQMRREWRRDAWRQAGDLAVVCAMCGVWFVALVIAIVLMSAVVAEVLQ